MSAERGAIAGTGRALGRARRIEGADHGHEFAHDGLEFCLSLRWAGVDQVQKVIQKPFLFVLPADADPLDQGFDPRLIKTWPEHFLDQSFL